MKKILFSIVLLVSATVYTSAQVSGSQNSKPADLSHWSIGIGGGVDYYRVAPSGEGHKNNASWAAPRISIEYTINPLFGIGVDGGYFAYNRSTAVGNTIDFTAYGSANLFNLLLPERTGFWGKVNVYGNLGAGFGLYHYKLATSNVSNDRDFTPVATLGLSAEYNLSKSWALGFESQYRAYTKENLGGAATAQLTNDALVGTVSFRYKFGANSKNHARNLTSNEYFSKPAQVIVEKAVNTPVDNKDELNRIKAVEDQNAALKAKLQKLEDDLNNLSSKNNDKPNSVSASLGNIEFKNIEFESNSSKLSSGSYATLDQIAKVLKNDNNWNQISVAGNTDNLGKADYNKKLSLNRANVIKKYLVSKGISGSSINVAGNGQENPITTNATAEGRAKNRRVEFSVK